MPNSKESLREPQLNSVHITGRLIDEPETNEIPSGAKVCNFTIVSNRTYKTKAGEKREDKLFIKVAAWDKLAEWLEQDLKKGRPVLVSGTLKMNEWESEGQKRTSISIVAHRVQILTWGHFDEEPEAKQKPTPEADIPF